MGIRQKVTPRTHTAPRPPLPPPAGSGLQPPSPRRRQRRQTADGNCSSIWSALSLGTPKGTGSAPPTAIRISALNPLGPQLACPAGCLLAPWQSSGMSLGGREGGRRTCTSADQGWGIGLSERKETGVSGGGSSRPISRGLGLGLREPRLRPWGGDEGTHRPSRAPRAGIPDAGAGSWPLQLPTPPRGLWAQPSVGGARQPAPPNVGTHGGAGTGEARETACRQWSCAKLGALGGRGEG